jgi:aspartate kinase
MPNALVKVLKFGGSSVGSVESLGRVVSIIKGETAACRPVVVVSALSGVTDLLVQLVDSVDPEPLIATLAKRHIDMAEAVLDQRRRYTYLHTISGILDGLRDRCHRRSDPFRKDGILATGELLSAPLVAGLLTQEGMVAQAIDARKLVVTRSSANGEDPEVDFVQTENRIAAWFADLSRFVLPIVTGYVASDEQGNTTVLGRGGSDYTASLFAAGINAAKFDRWTDVDGLYTADPNKVKGAGKFLFLLLEDASSWNESSALGMHAEAFTPVLEACIPVHVRSTRFPQGDGTLILPRLLPGRIERDSRRQLAHANHSIQVGPSSDKQTASS